MLASAAVADAAKKDAQAYDEELKRSPDASSIGSCNPCGGLVNMVSLCTTRKGKG